jgi:hypothetical protein
MTARGFSGSALSDECRMGEHRPDDARGRVSVTPPLEIYRRDVFVRSARRAAWDRVGRIMIQTERDQIREALSNSAATEDFSRRLGDELIEAGREVVRAYHELDKARDRMVAAVSALEKLVGIP